MKDAITSGTAYQIHSLKKIDTKWLNDKTEQVNKARKPTRTNNITKTNNLVNATSIPLGKHLGLKSLKWGQKKGAWSKRRVEGDMKLL